MRLTDEKRFEILTAELSLLQQRFMKYDDLIWKGRSWAVALVAALAGWGLSLEGTTSARSQLLLVAALVAGLFWFEEGLLRATYVWKFAVRYRRLRAAVNEPDFDVTIIALWDLTSHIEGRKSLPHRLRSGFFRAETFVFFVILAATPLILRAVFS